MISHNVGRLGKDLWTDVEDAIPLLYAGFNEQDEARFIVEQIQSRLEGNPRKSSAILYRSNAQSRVIEEALIRVGPHLWRAALLRAPRDSQRAGVLRLIIGRGDDPALSALSPRLPAVSARRSTIYARSLGKTTRFDVAGNRACPTKRCLGRGRDHTGGFAALINELDSETVELPQEMVEHVIHRTGLIEFHKAEKGDADRRGENLEELVLLKPLERRTIRCLHFSSFLTVLRLMRVTAKLTLRRQCTNDDAAPAKGPDLPLFGLTEENLFPHRMVESRPS